MAAATPAAPAGMPEVESMAERGWRLLPCAPRGKTPLLKRWPTLASSEFATVQGWAAKHPECNWGVATGPKSGVFVLDVDGEAGRASLAVLEAQHGPLSVTLTSITGRADGGQHRWFLYPDGCEIRGSAGKLGEGLDIRGARGYVIVPPSIHETGQPYQWAEPLRPVVDAPAWLIELLTDETGKLRVTAAVDFGILTEGKRNDGLTRYAGALRRRWAELPELESKLLEYNARHCKPPLQASEVCKIARSVARYPVGGPDPLEVAWKATQGENHGSRLAQFLALCRHLQSARPEQSIALPIERIGKLMGVHYTTVGIYRKEAVKRCWLEPAGQYIAHRRAGLYRLIASRIPKSPETLTKPLNPLTSGLVRISARKHPSENPENPPSEKAPSEFRPATVAAKCGPLPSFPRCPNCRSFALYRENNVGNYECLTCDLTGIEEDIARGTAGFSEKLIQNFQ